MHTALNPTALVARAPDLRPSISCVMPAYNEAGNLPQVVPQVIAGLRALSDRVEVIVVDDGSRDDTQVVCTALALQHSELVFVALSRNFGKECALTAGLDHAQGDVVVFMDSDGQHPVEIVSPMLTKWREGFDVVYTVRQSRDDQSALHGKLANLFYDFLNWRSRVKIPPHAGDFRLMDRRVADALRMLPERNRFMKGLYAWVGFKSCALPYLPPGRLSGQSHFGFRNAISLAITGLLAFSSKPLRALGVLGILLSAAAFFYGLWVILEYFWLGIDVPGYATLVVGMMFLSGIQLLSIGVLAEYVGHIYEEVKQRPAYLVMSRTGRGLGGDESAR
jgi:polyisoprenyl-phosphate glycosyltransferase